MTWSRERWDRVRDERDPRARPASGDAERQIERWLERLSAPESRTVADLGCGLADRWDALAARFGTLIAVDGSAPRVAALRDRHATLELVVRRRDLRDLVPFHGRIDAAIAVAAPGTRRLADLDKRWEQVRRCLREGGLFLGTYPATPRALAARPMLLDDGETPAPETMHEVELQYRLQRAGLLGATVRRALDDRAAEQLVFRAVRRADN